MKTIFNEIIVVLLVTFAMGLVIPTQARTEELAPCGLTGTIEQRIADCHLNKVVQPLIRFVLGGEVFPHFYTLVTLTPEKKAVWLDPETHRIWFMLPSTTFAESIKSCQDEENLSNRGNIQGIPFQLASEEEYRKALIPGLARELFSITGEMDGQSYGTHNRFWFRGPNSAARFFSKWQPLVFSSAEMYGFGLSRWGEDDLTTRHPILCISMTPKEMAQRVACPNAEEIRIPRRPRPPSVVMPILAFEKIKDPRFGVAVKALDGTVWSQFQGDYTNDVRDPEAEGCTVANTSPAQGVCARIGGQLPTHQDYEQLKSYFDLDEFGFFTDKGREDLYKIFPDMENAPSGRIFWTSTIYPGNAAYAYIFNPTGFTDSHYRTGSASIRCIHRVNFRQ